MGCRKGCGSSLGNIELIVKDLIRQMIEAGQLQEGLVDCSDKRLWRNTRVLTCDLLADAVCQLADEGALCFKEVDGIAVDGEQICILYNDGTKSCTTAKLEDTFIESGKVSGTKLVLSNNKGETVEVDLAAALKTVKAVVEDTADGYKITGTDGVEVVIPKNKVKAVKTGDDVVITNQDGTTVTVAGVKVNAETKDNGTVTITNQDGSMVTLPGVKIGKDANDLATLTITTPAGETLVLKDHRATVELRGLFDEEIGWAHTEAEGGSQPTSRQPIAVTQLRGNSL